MPHTTNGTPDPDDFFADTRMSFGDHIEELRSYLIRAIAGFAIMMVAGIWPLGKPVLNIISAPVERELFKFWKRTSGKRVADLQETLKTKVEVPRLQVTYLMDVRPIEERLAQRQGLALRHEDRSLEKMQDGIEDLLDDLGAAELLNKDRTRASHWVEVPVQIGDPEAYAKALAQLKPYFDPPLLRTLTITEAFVVYFKVAMLTGLVLSSPWVFYQIWAFVAAGLYPHEKKLVHVYLPFSLGLFLAGVVICEVYVVPKAVEALLWFNEWLGFQPELRLSDWLGFAIMMPLVFGVCFQTPLVMMFMHRIGLMGVATYRQHRRIALFVMAIVAAIITPTVDAVSMLLLWVPMALLYEGGIWLCVWQEHRAGLQGLEPAESSEEMVEV